MTAEEKKIKMQKLGRGELQAKIKFIGPDGVLRKFDEHNVLVITLMDNKGILYTIKND